MHLQDIYSSNELDEISTSKDFLLVQKEGNREVKRKVKYYKLYKSDFDKLMESSKN